MGLSPNALDVALRDGLNRSRWRVARPFRRGKYAIWMTTPTVRILNPYGNELRWDAHIHDYRGWGFTRGQAKQMRRALSEVIYGGYAELDSEILAILDRETKH